MATNHLSFTHVGKRVSIIYSLAGVPGNSVASGTLVGVAKDSFSTTFWLEGNPHFFHAETVSVITPNDEGEWE